MSSESTAATLSDDEFSRLFAPPETREVETDEGQRLQSPMDGQLINVSNADELIDAYGYAKSVNERIYTWMIQLREKISALCEGDQKTQRVRGRRKQVKVTFPDSTWDQSKLKEAWHAYPHLRDQLLSLATLRVKKREYKKAIATSGPADFEGFKSIVESAEREPMGIPSVTVEQDVV